MNNKNYHHGDLKEAIINSAQRILKEQGADALSLRVIASDVGVSHMAPYAHFKNKTELFQAIAANGFRSLASRMEDVDIDQKATVLILDYGTQYIEFAIANAPLYRMMLSQTQVTGPQHSQDTSNHMSQELKDASKKPFTLLVSAFAELSPDKATQNVQAQGAWAIVHGIASLLIDGHLNIPDDMSIKQFLAVASMQMPQ